MRRQLRVSTLPWAGGAFGTVIGALLLVAPQQFASSAYTVLPPPLLWWGGAFLLAGVGLLATAPLAPPWPATLGAYLVAGAVLLRRATGFGSARAVSGALVYGVLGLATLAAPLLPPPQRANDTVVDLCLAWTRSTSRLSSCQVRGCL